MSKEDKMAKRVSTPVGLANLSNNEKTPKKSDVGFVLLIALLLVVLVVSIVLINNALEEQEGARQQAESSQTVQPVQKPAEPVNIKLSGSGQSSTEQFELASGKYLVGYSFSNNLNYYGSFSDGANFISGVKCSDGFSLSISNDISSEGSGSEYLTIDTAKKCFYRVEKASSNASWSISISNS